MRMMPDSILNALIMLEGFLDADDARQYPYAVCVCLVADTPTLGPSTRSSKHILNASDIQTVS